ncbi:MAG: hypothetical protein LH478_04045 [Chitinophagaceae bacterium]|nr:hypothetical protein [Chitinophagaceae bacterium]
MNNYNDYTSDFFKDFLPSYKEQKKIDALMLLAAKISKGIKAKGWNKTQFAKAMGQTNTSIITKWLSGTNSFKVDTLLDIQGVLCINLLSLDDEASTEISATSISSPIVVNLWKELLGYETMSDGDLITLHGMSGVQVCEIAYAYEDNSN